MSAVDDVITRITGACNDHLAKMIVKTLPHRVLFAVADQLYIETEGHGTQWVRNAVLKEARS